MEIVGGATGADHHVHFAEAMQHPAFQFGHVRDVDPLGGVESPKIAEQPPQGVAQTSVGIDLAFDDFWTNFQVLGIIRRDHPKPQCFDTKLIGDFLWFDDIAQGLGHFTAVFGHDEAVREYSVIGRAPAGAAGFQQG